MGGAERAEGDSLAGGFRGIAGRWPDADVVLQGGMSEGLRDWDLWCEPRHHFANMRLCVFFANDLSGAHSYSVCS